jgi:hypothetical protein
MNAVGTGRQRHVNTVVDDDPSLAARRRVNARPNQLTQAAAVEIALANLDEIHARSGGSAYERHEPGLALVRRGRESMTIRHQATERPGRERAIPLSSHRYP